MSKAAQLYEMAWFLRERGDFRPPEILPWDPREPDGQRLFEVDAQDLGEGRFRISVEAELSEPARLWIEYGPDAGYGARTVMNLEHASRVFTEFEMDHRGGRHLGHMRFHLLDEAGNLAVTPDVTLPLED